MALTRRQWIWLVAGDVVLFLLANVTGGSGKNPGTVSNIIWGAFLIATALLILLAVVTLVRSLRRPAA